MRYKFFENTSWLFHPMKVCQDIIAVFSFTVFVYHVAWTKNAVALCRYGNLDWVEKARVKLLIGNKYTTDHSQTGFILLVGTVWLMHPFISNFLGIKMS